MARESSQSIEDLVAEIERWAAANNIPIVYGFCEPGKSALLEVVLSEEINLAKTLDALLGSAPKLITLQTSRFTQSDFDEITEMYAEEPALGDIDEGLRVLKRNIGKLGDLVFSLIAPESRLVATLVVTSDWYARFEALVENDDSDQWQEDPEPSERASWTQKRRTDAAKRLESDERFAKCKTEAARVALLKILLGEETPDDEHVLKEIAREAKGLADMK